MKNKLSNLILLISVALIAVTAVSYAWFTISDNARLTTMYMDVTSGLSLRIDLDAHENFEDYKQSLAFSDIEARIRSERGIDIGQVPMEPVTTSNLGSFTFEKGNAASAAEGHYIEFTLHFIAQGDMWVHLTSSSSKNADNGTFIGSAGANSEAMAHAMRIGFSHEGGTFIYDPGEDDIAGLTDGNRLFFIPENTDYPVTVYVWMEGTDPYCTNDLKGLEYIVRMRFEGSDENNNPLS